jgi:hypothetical protein
MAANTPSGSRSRNRGRGTAIWPWPPLVPHLLSGHCCAHDRPTARHSSSGDSIGCPRQRLRRSSASPLAPAVFLFLQHSVIAVHRPFPWRVGSAPGGTALRLIAKGVLNLITLSVEDQRCQVDFSRSYLGRPRGRREMSTPRRRAMRARHVGPPSGTPRSTLRRKALISHSPRSKRGRHFSRYPGTPSPTQTKELHDSIIVQQLRLSCGHVGGTLSTRLPCPQREYPRQSAYPPQADPPRRNLRFQLPPSQPLPY